MSLSPQEKLELLKRMGKMPYDEYEEKLPPIGGGQLHKKFLEKVKEFQSSQTPKGATA